MKRVILILITNLTFAFSSVVFTPSNVYREVVKIEKELKVIKEHFGILRESKKVYEIRTPLKPRNVWQLTYIVLLKINILRIKHSMPVITANSIAPVLNLDPNLVYEQTQRVLTELNIFKDRLAITKEIDETPLVIGKEPIDVFNKLLAISNELDVLNSTEISSSYIFSELMRIYEDVTFILNALNIIDSTIPPRQLKENMTSKDVFNKVLKLLNEIDRIQKTAKIDRVDFSSFKRDNITTSDVFILVEMVLTELSPIKAYLSLKYNITPIGKYYENKSLEDNMRLIGWLIERVKLIDSLRN